MDTIDKRVTEYIKCNACSIKEDGCKENCAKYLAYKKAYIKAHKIMKCPSLGIPRNDRCKVCKERVWGCHSTCEDYLLFKAYNEIIAEIKNKEKVTHSIRHIVGMRGL